MVVEEQCQNVAKDGVCGQWSRQGVSMLRLLGGHYLSMPGIRCQWGKWPTGEKSFVAVTHGNNGKFLCRNEFLPLLYWTPATKVNSLVAVNHCHKENMSMLPWTTVTKESYFVTVKHSKKGKFLCCSEPLWLKIFYYRGEPKRSNKNILFWIENINSK